MAEPNDRKRANRQPFDDTSKQFYERFFRDLGLETEKEKAVFTRSRTIDLVVFCQEENRAAIEKTFFNHFSTVNALELKGENDPLTPKDYYTILLRAYGLALKQENERIKQKKPGHFLPSQMSLTIICVGRPDTILDTLGDVLGFQTTDEVGLYYNKHQIPHWIVHPSELAVEPKNYPLLPLSRGKTLEQFIEICFENGLDEYLNLIIDLGMYTDPKTILRKLLEVKEMSSVFQLDEETYSLIDRAIEIYPELIERVSLISIRMAESREEGWQEGIAEGRQKGLEEGIQEGRQEGRQEGARRREDYC